MATRRYRMYSSSFGVAPRPLTSTADLVAAAVGQVGEDRPRQLVGDLVGGLERAAPHAGLAVDAHADLHLAAGSSNVGTPAAGIVHGDSATPIVRMPAAARSVDRDDLVERCAPAAAAAPATLYRKKIPAIPRRALARSGGADATSSAPRTVADLDALVGGELGRQVEVQHVAAVVAVQVQHAAPAGDGPRHLEHLSALEGEANTLPIAAPSISPLADVAHEHRQVARAAAGRDADLARDRRIGADDRPRSHGRRSWSGCAAMMPSSISSTKGSGSLRIFCIGLLPRWRRRGRSV